MKKLFLLGVGLMTMLFINAQDYTDALRYSQENIQGTARFNALSGAFGALGGDISAISINPAGSVIFAQSTANLTLGNQKQKNMTSYFGSERFSKISNFDLLQTGASFVFENSNLNSPWRKFALSIAYDRTKNFENSWRAEGINRFNTIGQYFLEFAQGQRLDEISAFSGETISEAYAEIGEVFGFGNQQAFLGYESFILDPEMNTDDNTNYINNITGGDYDQRFDYNATGYNGKLAFNFATQFEDRLHLGLNLNSHFINYERFTLLNEFNNNIGTSIINVNFENYLRATGSGFSFQLGSIFKLTNELRAGLAYDSPTWFSISEEGSQYVDATRNDNGSTITEVIDPNIINIYPEYRLQTPGKITGSLAYVFGPQGLISFDYSRKDYGSIKFRPTSDDYYMFQNELIENIFDTAATYRFGAEYRHKQLSFRGGYRFEESPYKDDSFYGNLTGYSLGLGVNFGNMTVDVSYSSSQRDVGYQLYSNSFEFTSATTIDETQNNFLLTLGFSI
ncbi:OmpP1/FadL family transporter [Winogradskyella sp. A3E31]|uniref:OmpP1/FadL family transporter n=1 Tax=Winogradskyella sp. A3E31 TaxID=3349637 RepID=UPI00398A8409